MKTIDRGLKPTNGNRIIWRYMSLDKFIDLLTYKELHFTNANHMTDQYEGVLPRKTVNAKMRSLESEGISSNQTIWDTIDEYTADWKRLKELTALSCWSLSREESYALWKIYLGGSTAGVALKTTVGALKRGILTSNKSKNIEINCSEVEYSDDVPENELNRYRLILRKYEFYKFEEEFRLFICEDENEDIDVSHPFVPPRALRIKVDLPSLIDNIFFSPFIGEWFQIPFRMMVEKIYPGMASKIVTSKVQDR